eukprot:TRINITY_DN2015_c1_g1_i2.p1 TRINITY_DN2015_c1_g1~~TRINITY_DN2015_c1_g1_i2.p1  ORF type:complete len:248 (-),score=58.70 TRINITY_DN2015_c1_g1_i2:85-828(-)
MSSKFSMFFLICLCLQISLEKLNEPMERMLEAFKTLPATYKYCRYVGIAVVFIALFYFVISPILEPNAGLDTEGGLELFIINQIAFVLVIMIIGFSTERVVKSSVRWFQSQADPIVTSTNNDLMYKDCGLTIAVECTYGRALMLGDPRRKVRIIVTFTLRTYGQQTQQPVVQQQQQQPPAYKQQQQPPPYQQPQPVTVVQTQSAVYPTSIVVDQQPQQQPSSSVNQPIEYEQAEIVYGEQEPPQYYF